MSDFNLKQLIRDVVKESKSPNPHVIASQVAKLIPSDHCEEVLAVLLPDAVREQIRQLRNVVPITREKPFNPIKDRRTGSNRSAKNDKIREAALSPFTWRISVPPKNTWKFLGECTGYECELIANDYFAKATQTTNNGNQYLRLSKAIKVDQKVSSLSEDEFWNIWKD